MCFAAKGFQGMFVTQRFVVRSCIDMIVVVFYSTLQTSALKRWNAKHVCYGNMQRKIWSRDQYFRILFV